MFGMDAACDGQCATAIVLHFVRHLSLDQKLGVHVPNLVRFLTTLEKGYLPPGEVPFHNHVHAADVAHATAYLLMQDKMRRLISPLDMWAAPLL